MRSVIYQGRWKEVEIETAPERWRRVKRGESIDVPDHVAESLCEQDAWADGSAGPADGTVDDVIARVGDDIDKARQALDAERAGKGRKGLLEHLEHLVTGPPAGDVNDGAERPKEDQ